MARSKKKRPREVMKAAAVPSPNGVESDVSASGSSPPSTSSTPIKHGSTTSTPIQNGTMKYNNDDPSTWSKSKKNRMRKKGKKDAAKKLLMVVEGASANRSSKQATPGSANDGKRNAISPSKKTMSSGATDDSNKRLRKNPVESPSATAKNGKSGKMKQAVADGSSPPNKKKKSNTPTVMLNDDNTQKSPPKSNQTKVVESPGKSSEVNQVAADGSTPKKTKKKKKKPNTPTSTKEQAQKSPSDSNQNNKDPINNSAKKSPSKSNQDTISNSTNDESNSNNTIAKPSPQKLKISLPKPSQMSTLQKAFLERLTSSRFRELNEELYTHESGHSFEYFTKNPELFDQYHVGFRKQAEEWPVNPIDVIYKKILKDYANGKKKEKGEKTSYDDGQGRKQVVVADFGCGDAKLAERLLALQTGNDGKTLTQAVTKKKKAGSKDQVASCPFKVFSFDLVSGGNPLVTPADMSNVPLPNESVDLGVYSLALMGTNVADFVREAWRVLKFNGVLRVAEVRSRFETAAAADENEKKGGGGKRAKLNNKLKHPKKTNHKKDNSQDGEKAPQPIMLLDEFIALMERCGFQCTNMDRSNKMFLFMDFTKVDGSKGLSKKESFTAKPCIYKRR